MTAATKPHLFYWLVLSAVVLGADYGSGPAIQFPIAFVVPVLLAAWYNGKSWAFGMAVALPLARLLFHHYWEDSEFNPVEIVNLVIRIAVLAGMAYFVDRTAALGREIKVLKGLLPVCSACKKIRTEEGAWKEMEVYISEKSEAEFTHGLCQECAERIYGDFVKKRKKAGG